MARVIGVDPGFDGALALLDDDEIVDVLDMPTLPVLVNGRKKRTVDAWRLHGWIVDAGRIDAVAVERVTSFRMGSTSAFNFGTGYGMALGVLYALERPVVLVEPQTWTRALGLDSDKSEHRLEAMRRYPSRSDLFRLAKHDGRADAVLLAAYAAGRLTRSAA